MIINLTGAMARHFLWEWDKILYTHWHQTDSSGLPGLWPVLTDSPLMINHAPSPSLTTPPWDQWLHFIYPRQENMTLILCVKNGEEN